ncbi:hypothetical protein ACIPZL_004219, partial [Escherichia coli]
MISLISLISRGISMGLVSFDITCPHCLKERAVIEAFAENKLKKHLFLTSLLYAEVVIEEVLLLLKSHQTTITVPWRKARKKTSIF